MFFDLFRRKNPIDKIKIEDLVKSLGGKENIISHEICSSRVRFTILNFSKLDENLIKKCDLPGYSILDNNRVHIIIGPDIKKFYEKLKIYI